MHPSYAVSYSGTVVSASGRICGKIHHTNETANASYIPWSLKFPNHSCALGKCAFLLAKLDKEVEILCGKYEFFCVNRQTRLYNTV